MLSQRPIGIGLAPQQAQGARMTYPLVVTSLFGGNSVLFGTTQTFDLTMEDENGTINNVQTMFVDNSLSPSAFLFTFPETGQTIWAKAKTQGYYPIGVGQQVQMQARCMTGGGTGYSCQVQFLNVPVEPSQWSTAQDDKAFCASSINAGNTAFTINPQNPFPGMGPTNYPGIYGGAVTGKMALKIYGFDISGTGATASGDVQVTLTSPVNGFGPTTTLGYDIFVPVLGAGNVNFSVRFNPPLYPAGGTTGMLLTVPAMGAGQTYAAGALFYGLV